MATIISFPCIESNLPTLEEFQSSRLREWSQFYHLEIQYEKLETPNYLRQPLDWLTEPWLDNARIKLLLPIGKYSFFSKEVQPEDYFGNLFFYCKIKGDSYGLSVIVGMAAASINKTISPFVTLTGVLDLTISPILCLTTEEIQDKLLLCLGFLGYESFPTFYSKQKIGWHLWQYRLGTYNSRTRAGEVRFFFVPKGSLEKLNMNIESQRLKGESPTYDILFKETDDTVSVADILKPIQEVRTPRKENEPLFVIEVETVEESLQILGLREISERTKKKQVTRVWREKREKYTAVIEKPIERQISLPLAPQIKKEWGKRPISICISDCEFVFCQTQHPNLFFLQTPVTWIQYCAVCEQVLPAGIYSLYPFPALRYFQKSNLVQEIQTWLQCFSEKLYKQYPSCQGVCHVRLPTVNEWINSCTKEERDHPEQFANIEGRNVLPVANDKRYSIFVREPNIYGLFDLLGNVWEVTKNDSDYIFMGGSFESKRTDFVSEIPCKLMSSKGEKKLAWGFRPVLDFGEQNDYVQYLKEADPVQSLDRLEKSK